MATAAHSNAAPSISALPGGVTAEQAPSAGASNPAAPAANAAATAAPSEAAPSIADVGPLSSEAYRVLPVSWDRQESGTQADREAAQAQRLAPQPGVGGWPIITDQRGVFAMDLSPAGLLGRQPLLSMSGTSRARATAGVQAPESGGSLASRSVATASKPLPSEGGSAGSDPISSSTLYSTAASTAASTSEAADATGVPSTPGAPPVGAASVGRPPSTTGPPRPLRTDSMGSGSTNDGQAQALPDLKGQPLSQHWVNRGETMQLPANMAFSSTGLEPGEVADLEASLRSAARQHEMAAATWTRRDGGDAPLDRGPGQAYDLAGFGGPTLWRGVQADRWGSAGPLGEQAGSSRQHEQAAEAEARLLAESHPAAASSATPSAAETGSVHDAAWPAWPGRAPGSTPVRESAVGLEAAAPRDAQAPSAAGDRGSLDAAGDKGPVKAEPAAAGATAATTGRAGRQSQPQPVRQVRRSMPWLKADTAQLMGLEPEKPQCEACFWRDEVRCRSCVFWGSSGAVPEKSEPGATPVSSRRLKG